MIMQRLELAQRIMSDFIRTKSEAELPVSMCFVDTGVQELVIGLDLKRKMKHEELIARVQCLIGKTPIRLEAVSPQRMSHNNQLQVRPVQGALQMEGADRGIGTITAPCTIIEDFGFLVSGHVAKEVDQAIYQTGSPDEIGTVAFISDYMNGSCDAAWVLANEAGKELFSQGIIWRKGGTIDNPNFFAIDEVWSSEKYEIGQNVFMAGSNIEDVKEGVVLGKDATVRFSDGGTLTNQVITSYSTTPGDSGAPVFVPLSSSRSNKKVAFLGINAGITDPDNPPLDLKKGSYGVFSPWEAIQYNIGITDGDIITPWEV